jgi:RNA polymerase sigma-70 factor (ECF subfamily)
MEPPAEQLSRLRRGDESAWGELHREHYARLWSSVQRILNNPTMADDVVQEAFIKAHRDIRHFEGNSQLGTWLYRIAVNQALDTIRKRQRTERWLSFLSPLSEGDQPALLPEGQVAPAVSTGLENKDLRDIIFEAMGELSAEHRAVVQLRLVDEMSLEETARLLRCKPGTVNSRLHYACEHLRRKLARMRKPGGPELE